MKKLLLHTTAAVVLVTGAVAAYAQAPSDQNGGQWGHGQPPTAEQRLQRMTRQLNLSDDQQQKIKPILENESTQMQSLRADTTLSQQDRMAKMQEIRKNTSEQVTPILNTDQQQKYSEMMSRQGHGRGAPGQNPPGQNPPDQSQPASTAPSDGPQ